MITALVLAKRTERYLLAGWLFFLGTLVPVIGIVQVGSQAIADRYTYIPYLGLFAMAAFGGAPLQNSKSRPLNVSLLAVAGVALASFCFLTLRHVPRWKDSRTLFSYVIENMPNNAEAWFHLADASMANKDYSSAISEFRQGLKFSPNDQKALNNLGTAYIHTNNPREALKCYEAALRIDPQYALAARNRDLLQKILSSQPPASP
jgi:tetratricopeptide (TPR) repeat protein